MSSPSDFELNIRERREELCPNPECDGVVEQLLLVQPDEMKVCSHCGAFWHDTPEGPCIHGRVAGAELDQARRFYVPKSDLERVQAWLDPQALHALRDEHENFNFNWRLEHGAEPKAPSKGESRE